MLKNMKYTRNSIQDVLFENKSYFLSFSSLGIVHVSVVPDCP